MGISAYKSDTHIEQYIHNTCIYMLTKAYENWPFSKKNYFKIPAKGANDRQFGPELRTVFLSSANIMDFSALRF